MRNKVRAVFNIFRIPRFYGKILKYLQGVKSPKKFSNLSQLKICPRNQMDYNFLDYIKQQLKFPIIAAPYRPLLSVMFKIVENYQSKCEL